MVILILLMASTKFCGFQVKDQTTWVSTSMSLPQSFVSGLTGNVCCLRCAWNDPFFSYAQETYFATLKQNSISKKFSSGEEDTILRNLPIALFPHKGLYPGLNSKHIVSESRWAWYPQAQPFTPTSIVYLPFWHFHGEMALIVYGYVSHKQALGVGDGQGSLACCNPWGREELDTTEEMNWTELMCPQLEWVLQGHIHYWIHLWIPNLGRVNSSWKVLEHTNWGL